MAIIFLMWYFLVFLHPREHYVSGRLPGPFMNHCSGDRLHCLDSLQLDRIRNMVFYLFPLLLFKYSLYLFFVIKSFLYSEVCIFCFNSSGRVGYTQAMIPWTAFFISSDLWFCSVAWKAYKFRWLRSHYCYMFLEWMLRTYPLQLTA